MRWVLYVVVGMLAFSVGCVGFGGDADSRSTVDLTVQNDRTQSVSFLLTVTDGDDGVIVNESERLDSGVGRTFDFTVGAPGRHEATVAADDARGQVARNADICGHFDATIRISDERIEVAGECLEQR